MNYKYPKQHIHSFNPTNTNELKSLLVCKICGETKIIPATYNKNTKEKQKI